MASFIDIGRRALASRCAACTPAGLCGAALLVAAGAAAWAQSTGTPAPAGVVSASAPSALPTASVPRTAPSFSAAVPSSNAAWAALTPAQRTVLKPLEREWGAIDGNRRQKWLEVAERLPRMSPDDQARVQARMVEWAAMTPQQRAQVRLQFQEAKQVAPKNRKESWDAYQALPPDERSRLAVRAASEADRAVLPVASAAGRGFRADHARESAQPKSNIVTPGPAPAPRAVAPTVVQAQTGATTTLMSRRPDPPAHQQVGLPKIAATPDFVNRATLLPQRGAQGAGVRGAPAAPEPMVPGHVTRQ